MELRQCTLQLPKSVEQQLIQHVGAEYQISRFHRTIAGEDRQYDVYQIKSDSGSFILKRTEDDDEINAYGVLKKLATGLEPRVYFVASGEKESWIAMEEILNGDGNFECKDIQKLAMGLAEIHAGFGALKDDFPELRRWKPLVAEDLRDADIQQEQVDTITKSQDRLKNALQTFVHCDMIPLNALRTDDGVRILDWDTGKVGPYILDMGRLLGDFNVDRPWVDSAWEKPVLKAYHLTLSQNGVHISFDVLYLDYLCAKLHNYLGIVGSHLRNGWEKTDWYRLNLREMKSVIDSIGLRLD